MKFFFPVRKRTNEIADLRKNFPSMGATYYRSRRQVREGVIKHYFKYYTAEGIERFNGMNLHLFENTKGDFFAVSTGGIYCFELKKLTKEEAKTVQEFNRYRHRHEEN